MRIPAINGKMGDWNYYITLLTFDQVDKHVLRIGDELHKSKTLSDMIQRTITNNYLSIKKYLLENNERFFNSVVLALYDGDPKWIEVDFDYGEKRYTSMGLLEFNGEEKIFPVDGQHRIEGIKSALEKNKELITEEIPVIIISHRKSNEGMERTRRLFSTLNRYAKPVTMSEIIALDEDDVVAISTRNLVENHRLFYGRRTSLDKTKAISDKNKTAFTSIETLYKCNLFLLKSYLKRARIKYHSEYLRRRPETQVVKQFISYCDDFWNAFAEKLNVMNTYLENNSENASSEYRNNNTGGCLLFRPIGLQPFVNSVIEIHNKTDEDFGTILKKMNHSVLELNKIPWKQVLWNDYEKVMMLRADKLVSNLFIYMYNSDLLTPSNLNYIIKSYSGKLNISENEITEVLEDIENIVKNNVF
ncbi:DNA sulfur modification protein DndB [Bacillus mesophilum]|uniref:DGQHR domain-containing protein n=1 Tax=Bacillus mesophilum TaxID=1071718 RepID=A0A7V7RKY7_9BACI|nr:DNA sulfur modification protein DndB [Bacillus mesophilum]KAB2331290.1 DGQHR domain-containing protein [Bacillus mesophilum]